MAEEVKASVDSVDPDKGGEAARNRKSLHSKELSKGVPVRSRGTSVLSNILKETKHAKQNHRDNFPSQRDVFLHRRTAHLPDHIPHGADKEGRECLRF